MKRSTILFILLMSCFSLYPFSFKTMLRNIRKRTVRVISQQCDAMQNWLDENPEFFEQALLTGMVGAGSYWLWMRSMSINPFKKIIIKESKINAATTQYGGVHLIQVEVKNQLDSDGGGRASCAYHAINNAERIVGLLSGRIRNLMRALFNTDKLNERFGKQGRWRNQVRRMRIDQREDENWRPRGDFVSKGNSWLRGDWLHGEEIDALMQRPTRIPRYPYDVVDDVDMLGLRAEPVCADRPEEAIGDPIIPAVRQALCTALRQGREYIHQFFINTAQHFQRGQEGSVSGYDGHWFSVVLYQDTNGERFYFIADSYRNNILLQDDRVHRLVDLIEAPDRA